jgi:hypothetical protein
MLAKSSIAARCSSGGWDRSQANHAATTRGAKCSLALSMAGALPAAVKASAQPAIIAAALSAANVSKNPGDRLPSAMSHFHLGAINYSLFLISIVKCTQHRVNPATEIRVRPSARRAGILSTNLLQLRPCGSVVTFLSVGQSGEQLPA